MRAHVHKLLEKVSPFWEQDEYTKIKKITFYFVASLLSSFQKSTGQEFRTSRNAVTEEEEHRG